MTNADKYLKDEVNVEELAWALWCYVKDKPCTDSSYSYRDFFNAEIKPTLTEDEKAILRNIDKKFIKIGRDHFGLYFVFTEGEQRYYANIFNDLFKFIKERRRIRDKGVARR